MQQIYFRLRKYEIIIASAFVILSVIGLSIVFLIPNFSKAGDVARDKETLRKKLNMLKDKDNKLVTIDYPYYQKAYLKMDQILPQGKDYVSLFSTFDNLEQTTGVRVIRTDFQLGPLSTTSGQLVKAPGTSAFIIPVIITVIGDDAGLKQFIRGLSDFSGRLINLDDLKWSKGENVSQLVMSGKAFFYPMSSTMVRIDSPIPDLDKNKMEIIDKIANLPDIQNNVPIVDKTNVGKSDLFQ